MRRTPIVAAGILAGGLALATLATAQPRGRPAKPVPRPKSSAADNPYDDKGPPAPAGSASAAAAAPPAVSSGAVPPPPVAAGGGALSPLNPAPGEFSDGGAPPSQLDYDRLLADIAGLRARVAAVSDTLFHSRIAVTLETSGDHGRIASLAVSLDDGVVWTSPASFRAEDAATVYEHAVAPGHHALTVDVDRRDDRDDTFRTAQRSRFVVDVPADQRLAVALRIWDDSSMGGDFKSDHSGTYDLRVRLKAQAHPLGR